MCWDEELKDENMGEWGKINNDICALAHFDGKSVELLVGMEARAIAFITIAQLKGLWKELLTEIVTDRVPGPFSIQLRRRRP
jgi:hypothetical protein